jgi:hypothetical protein
MKTINNQKEIQKGQYVNESTKMVIIMNTPPIYLFIYKRKKNKEDRQMLRHFMRKRRIIFKKYYPH